MSREDDERAHAAKMQALLAMRRPQDHTPWKDPAPEGRTLVKALYASTLPSFHKSVGVFLADVEVGLFPERWPQQQDHFWRHVLWRLQQGQLVARGRREGGDMPQNVPLDMLDDATPDFEANSLTCAGVLFRSVRVFEAGEAPDAGALPSQATSLPDRVKGRGGRPPHSAQTEFIKEMIRFALRPDGFETRDQLAQHMSEWAKTNLPPGDPDDRTMRRWVDTYCPGEIPTV